MLRVPVKVEKDEGEMLNGDSEGGGSTARDRGGGQIKDCRSPLLMALCNVNKSW